MSNEDEKLDKFLKTIIGEVETDTLPDGGKFTNQVMLQIASLDKSGQKAKSTAIGLGILMYTALGIFIYLFLNSSFAISIKMYLEELVTYLPFDISLQRLGLIVGGFIFYLVLVRIVLAVLMLRQKQARIQYS